MLDSEFLKGFLASLSLFGLLVVLCIPVFLYFFDFDWDGYGDFSFRTAILFCIAANALLVRYFRNRYLLRRVRGAGAGTLILMIVWLIIFGRYII